METISPLHGFEGQALLRSPFGGIPRNWKRILLWWLQTIISLVPPSGGSLEIGNSERFPQVDTDPVPPSGGSLEIGNRCAHGGSRVLVPSSPFGGIPRNWKPRGPLPGVGLGRRVPPSGGSLEIGNIKATRSMASHSSLCSPFGGIPRNWKLLNQAGDCPT